MELFIIIAIMLGLLYLSIILLYKRNNIQSILLNIAKSYELKYNKYNYNTTPEVYGVINNAYFRIWIPGTLEIRRYNQEKKIIISSFLEILSEQKYEIRRTNDFVDWVITEKPCRYGKENSREIGNLSLHKMGMNELVVDDKILQEIERIFSGNGEWRINISKNDAEIIWRGSLQKVSYNRLNQVILGFIELQKILNLQQAQHQVLSNSS